ncbi:MAG: serine hydrolase [Thermoanaerobaculia bacterium]
MRATSALQPLLIALAFGACSRPPAPVPSPDADAYAAGRIQFPAARWAAVDPSSLGWSAEALQRVHTHWEGLDSAALMVVHRGVPIVQWGSVAERYTVQSVRKSLLGALIGCAVADGDLDLDATLAELDVDDSPPALTERERTATVEDLLRSRSDVFHSALYEAGSWKRSKPARGSHAPGSYWYYNNWDFNVLGTLFERSAGTRIGPAFRDRIAGPVGMEDFRPRDVVYLTRRSLSERIMHNDSLYPAYIFRLSTRDLARFGLLILARGRWGDERILPESWVDASTRGPAIGWLEGDETTRYGYLWWIYPPDSWLGRRVGAEVWLAQGARGHWLAVVPDLDLVFAHQVATGGVGLPAQIGRRIFGSPEVGDAELGDLLGEVVAALPERAAAGTR